MAGFFTDYMNNRILDLVFGASGFTPPATIYVGLAKNGANKSGSLHEVSGVGYARLPITNNSANFPAAASGTKSNATAVTFAPPLTDWGTVVSLFLADTPNGGNVLAMADLATPKTISAGSPAPTVAIGALFLSHT